MVNHNIPRALMSISRCVANYRINLEHKGRGEGAAGGKRQATRRGTVGCSSWLRRTSSTSPLVRGQYHRVLVACMQHEHTHSSMKRAIPTASKIGTFMGLAKRLAVRGLRKNSLGRLRTQRIGPKTMEAGAKYTSCFR